MANLNDMQALVKNPESFLKDNRLAYSIAKDVGGKKVVEMVRVREKSYKIQLSKTVSQNTISAYVLGYYDNKENDALYLDIPITGVDEGTLFFTSGLTGCSIVVTLLNKNTYRVFHDYRMNSAVLYDKIVMCLDYDDYKVPGLYSAGDTVVCMQFRNRAWKLYVQQQYPPTNFNMNGLYLVVKDAVNASEVPLQKSFAYRRDWMQHRMKDLAKAFNINSALIDKAKDGTYAGGGKFDANDPSIRGWNELRNAIQKELGDKQKEAKAADQLKKSSDAVFWNYQEMLRDSEGLDKIWLWLQVNKATGKNGNSSTRSAVG